MREKLLEEIEERKPLDEDVEITLQTNGVSYTTRYDVLHSWIYGYRKEYYLQAYLRDIAKSLRILNELFLEHLGEHRD